MSIATEFGIVWLILRERIVNCSQQYFRNDNDRFIVVKTFFERKVMVADFRELFCTDFKKSIEQAVT